MLILDKTILWLFSGLLSLKLNNSKKNVNSIKNSKIFESFTDCPSLDENIYRIFEKRLRMLTLQCFSYFRQLPKFPLASAFEYSGGKFSSREVEGLESENKCKVSFRKLVVKNNCEDYSQSSFTDISRAWC